MHAASAPVITGVLPNSVLLSLPGAFYTERISSACGKSNFANSILNGDNIDSDEMRRVSNKKVDPRSKPEKKEGEANTYFHYNPPAVFWLDSLCFRFDNVAATMTQII
ncbi:hypothetical protein LSTR_LSTR016387 [Laodelphax striatellus]|uniref:Uncharacterized protein n=1 Tax=Laodelphax striatellus TaxID=195883 RepID=A0A482WIY9_LAOST|nr:hypothetical protein LSTR_LSTR016387 [Laodelphax striatellus]